MDDAAPHMTDLHPAPPRADAPAKRACIVASPPLEFADLPNELIAHIVAQLDSHVDAVHMRMVNSRMHDIVDDVHRVAYKCAYNKDGLMPGDAVRMVESVRGGPAYIDYMYGRHWMTACLRQLFTVERAFRKSEDIRTEARMWSYVTRWKLYNIDTLLVCAHVAPIDLPATIGRFGELTCVELYGWDDAKLPVELGDLPKLDQLVFGQMQHVTRLPDTLSQLTLLRDLQVREMPRLTHLFSRVGGLVSLRELYIKQCDAIATLPANITQLTNLERLDLMGLPLFRDIPSVLYDLHSIDMLAFDQVPVTTVSARIGQLTRLNCLHLERMPIETLPRELGRLSRLRTLTVRECPRFVRIPPELGQLAPSLTRLYIRSNPRLASVPRELGQLTRLIKLTLYGNHPDMCLPPAVVALYTTLFPQRVRLQIRTDADETWTVQIGEPPAEP